MYFFKRLIIVVWWGKKTVIVCDDCGFCRATFSTRRFPIQFFLRETLLYDFSPSVSLCDPTSSGLILPFARRPNRCFRLNEPAAISSHLPRPTTARGWGAPVRRTLSCSLPRVWSRARVTSAAPELVVYRYHGIVNRSAPIRITHTEVTPTGMVL